MHVYLFAADAVETVAPVIAIPASRVKPTGAAIRNFYIVVTPRGGILEIRIGAHSIVSKTYRARHERGLAHPFIYVNDYESRMAD
jgi:hypothetical protein